MWSLVDCLIVVLFPNPFLYGCLLICFVFCRIDLNCDWLIHQLIDWLIDRSVDDWLIDRPFDRSIDWLIGCWLTGSSGSFIRSRLLVLFYSVPCAHERCDPCEFLLALRGFVELISVMVRFRSSVLFRPRPPRCDWKLPRLGPWARSRTSKGSPPQPEFMKPNTVQKTSFLSSKRLRFSNVLAIWRVGYLPILEPV